MHFVNSYFIRPHVFNYLITSCCASSFSSSKKERSVLMADGSHLKLSLYDPRLGSTQPRQRQYGYFVTRSEYNPAVPDFL
jgi:hypothetical protein